VRTWEIRYSSSPITNANYSAATLVPLTYRTRDGSGTLLAATISGHTGGCKKIAWEGGQPGVWVDFDLPSAYKVAGTTTYFAIKEISAIGEHSGSSDDGGAD